MAKIAILGGGFGGLEAARAARKEGNHEITLIDKNAKFTFHGHLHELVSGRMKPEELEIDLGSALKKIGVNFVQAEIISIKNKKIITKTQAIDFDSLIIAMGSKTCFSVKGIRSCDELKETNHAIQLRQHLTANLSQEVIIVGAGLTGVELAMEVAELSNNIKTHLVEAQDLVMPGFPELARKLADNKLRKSGVIVHYGKKIQRALPHTLILENGIKLPYDLLVWTAGIEPASHINSYGLESNKGFIKVNNYLQTSAKNCFAVGDIAWLDIGGKHELWTAVTALREGRIAGINASRILDNKQLIRYVPEKKHLFLISLGKKTGILTYGNFVLYGKFPLIMKRLFFYWYMRTRK